MRRSSLAVVIVAALAAGAMADPKSDAKALVEKAAKHYGSGDFTTALGDLEAAYALDPQPGMLYSIAQVNVKLDRCEEAVTFYTRYLDTGPEPKAKKATEEAIASCKTKLAAAAPPPTPPPPTTPPEPVATATPSEPAEIKQPERPAEPRAWYKDPLGGVLVGAGLVGSVVGVVLYTSARSDVDAAEKAATYEAGEKMMDDARKKRTYGVIAGVAGIALIGAGVVRYVIVRGRSTDENVAITPTGDGAAITWSGRF